MSSGKYIKMIGERALDHFLELRLHIGGEVGLDFIDIAELGEGPAAVGGEVVHAGDPVGLHWWWPFPWRPRGGSL
jgi:hypothetical protein